MDTGLMEVCDPHLWAIGLVLDMTIDQREPSPRLGVKMIPILSDLWTAIEQVAHSGPGPM